jgi:hypothetical protein
MDIVWDAGALIGAALGLAATVGGGFIVYGRMQANVDDARKTAYRAIEDSKDVRRELDAHKVYAAREFVDRHELDGVAKQFTDAISAFGDRLESGFRHIATRIDAMVDRRPSEG